MYIYVYIYIYPYMERKRVLNRAVVLDNEEQTMGNQHRLCVVRALEYSLASETGSKSSGV